MQGLPYKVVTYCSFGYPYKKATALWHSRAFGEAFQPRPPCCRATPCPAFAADGVHPKSAQRGTSRTRGGGRKIDDNCSLEMLYSMPPELCDEIAEAAERAAQEVRAQE